MQAKNNKKPICAKNPSLPRLERRIFCPCCGKSRLARANDACAYCGAD